MNWIEKVEPEWPATMLDEPVPEEYLLPDELGFEGEIKQSNQDFQVSEVLGFEPSGTGPNTFIRVQKENVSTLQLIQFLAEFLDRELEDFCVTDYKGPRSIAIQWISLEHLDPRDLDNFEHPDIDIIQITRHKTRLKPVDLAGNRFEVTVRETDKDALEKARQGFEVFKRRGVPNWFGGQCFGYRKKRHLLGWALVKKKWEWFLYELLNNPTAKDSPRLKKARSSAGEGDWERALDLFPESFKAEKISLESLIRYTRNKERACGIIPPEYRRFHMLALQGYAFNKFLERRLGRYDRLQEGDVAYMHESSGCFPVIDPQDEKPRMDRFEISPSGPLFGEKFLGASGEVEELEDSVIEEIGLSYLDFQRSKFPVPGRRRPLRAPLTQVRAQQLEDDVLDLSFFLPRGSYATVVLEELMHKRFDYDEEVL